AARGAPAWVLSACLASVLPADPSHAQTAAAQNELNTSKAVLQIGASTAYGLKYTGTGVKIAVLDTGVNAGNRDLGGRLLAGRNFTLGSPNTNVADGNGHGTHVAGLIAANRNSVGMFGVAYSAQILPVKVIANNGAGASVWVDAGLRWAADQGAFLANLSLGGSAATNPAAMQYAVGKGMLIVAAAGNSGQAQPGWPARYAGQAWAKGQVINVVAVDSANRIASWSNCAGDAMYFTLAAPGVSLTSTYGTGYAAMSGTSMATPVVTGAAALIKSRWTYLNAKDVAGILFVTATDLGAAGVDPVFGRGLVNVDRAMKPVGEVATVAYGGRKVPIYATSTGGAVNSALQTAAGVGLLKVSGLDAFGRDFAFDLGGAVARPRPLLADELFAFAQPEQRVGDRRFSVALGNAFASAPVAHLGFMENASSVTGRIALAGGWTLAPTLAAQAEKASATSMALSHALTERSELGVATTQMSEHNGYLGGSNTGLFGLGRATTTAVALFGRAQPAPGTVLSASVSLGTTPGAQGALLGTSAVASHALRATWTQHDVLREGDALTVAFEQPMRVHGGTLTVTRMTGVDEAGAPVMASGSVPMTPDGRELRLGFGYQMPLDRRSTLQLSAMLRHEPGHIAGAPMQAAAALRYQSRF
ncbi:MAG TPA: S8 family serine peptidase, partial [Quisquiliibacterium sp.]|nr:S8 family serine peptidase [Quisquiliibacterium sp.]